MRFKIIAAGMVMAFCLSHVTAKAFAGIASVRSMLETSAADVETLQEESSEEESINTQPSTAGVVSQGREVLVYAAADENGSVVGTLYEGNYVDVTPIDEEWCMVRSGSLFGYAETERMVTGDEELLEEAISLTAEITADEVRVRSEASEDSEILGTVFAGQSFTAEECEEEDWVAICYKENWAYVSADYVSLTTGYSYGETLAETRQREDSATDGGDVVEFACRFVGNPYSWGGTSLTNGADCSGFVMAVYANFGISLPHSSTAMRSCGYEVSYEEAQPGDIICYSGHVAIYVGDGMIVHAFNSRQGIVVSEAQYKSIICVRRIY